MTLPPQGSPHYELRRRIAGCRERLRKSRSAHREVESGTNAQANEIRGGDSSADDEEEDGRRARRLNSQSR
ncbi:MAG: hypothetical protein QOF61_148 [Acidobacteriota bacterium]|jgi:hypothetical protein|nr:hypothetical protein [Acidobacteriota bacterium]